jgi:hypothetical protein
MSATIDRPGVQVIQTFQTVSPTVLRPALPACVIGPAFQVVEAIDDQGVFVSDARLATPARLTASFVSSPFKYTVGGDDLVLSVNGRAPITIQFPAGPDLTVDEVVDAVNEAAIPGLLALVEVSGTQKRAVFYTAMRGDNAALRVDAATDAGVRTAFGFGTGVTGFGAAGYSNRRLDILKADYPNPRNNIDELVVDYTSTRVFLNDGAGNVREVLTTETFLRGATSAVSVHDDGDGDNLSPYLDFASENFSSAPAPAQATGVADMTSATYANIQNAVFRMSLDGQTPQTLIFSGTAASGADVVSEINALFGTGVASMSGNYLRITSPASNGGRESAIRIDKEASGSTMLDELGLVAGGPFAATEVIYGTAYRPQVGDAVWVDGMHLGEITEVPASPTDRLRISREQLLSFTGVSWSIIAQGLDNQLATATRPSSDLYVDADSGTVRVKHELFRETGGVATRTGPLSTYLAYTALRQDVSPAGKDFNLLRIGTTTMLAHEMSPISTQNPLALGMYFAMLNAPGVEITGLGVESVSSNEPEGALTAYSKAFEYLESKDVYAIAPMTHALAVGQVGHVHVEEMSKPGNGLERRLIFNPNRPTRKADTLVASTATANVAGPPTSIIQSGIANLQTLLAAAGKPGPAYTEADKVYVEITGSTNKYLVQSVSGGTITINNGPLSAGNDVFYDAGGTAVFTSVIVDRPLSVKILGGSIGNLTEEATAYADVAQGFRDRRVICTTPDKARASIDGLEKLIEGYYLCAGLAGRMSGVSPQQGLTNDRLVGFSGVSGSNDRYGELQLKIMSGGGLWSFVQETSTSPVTTRHQLTTDMSSVETREDSITRVLDFVAKTVRSALRTFIGGVNITTSVQDAVNSTLDGLGRFLVKIGVLTSFTVNALRQSQSQPDTLEVDITCGVGYPLNTIRVTLVI